MRFVKSPLRRLILSGVLMLILSAGFVSAQDDAEATTETCDIDLSGTIATLVQAQAAASGGDLAEAQVLIAEAQTELDAIAACETDGGEPVSFDLTETYDYIGERGFSFAYPEGWITFEDRDDQVALANSQQLIDEAFFYQTAPGSVDEGEYTGLVALQTPREFGIADVSGLAPAAYEFGEAIVTQLQALRNIESTDPVEEIELDNEGGEAALVTIRGEGYVFVIVVQYVDEVQFAEQVNEPESLFLFTALAGAPADVATVRQTAIDIATSTVYVSAESE